LYDLEQGRDDAGILGDGTGDHAKIGDATRQHVLHFLQHARLGRELDAFLDETPDRLAFVFRKRLQQGLVEGHRVSPYSRSSMISTQCRTGVALPLCRWVWQPILAVTMTVGVPADSAASLLSRSCFESSGCRIE
jgi:hypothetical protein